MKKKWHVTAHMGAKGGLVVQYCGSKKEANQIKKQVDKVNEHGYAVVDSVRMTEYQNVPFHELHGNGCTKVASIL